MTYLKLVLLIVVVNYHFSYTMSQNRSFNELTLTELNASCAKNNQSYKEIQTSSLPIWKDLLMNTSRHCSGEENEKLIRQLIDETLKCFDEDQYLNNTDDIVDEIKNKLCSYYKIGNFKTRYKDCIIFPTVQDCASKISLEIDDYFFSLAMIHSKTECDRLLHYANCTRDGMVEGCGPTITGKYEVVIKEFSNSLKCQKS